MKQRPHPFLLALAVLILASLACQAFSSTNATATPTYSFEPLWSPTAPTAPVEPVTVASQGVGIACIGSTTGLSCLDEKGWHLYTEDNSNLPNNYLYAGAVCPDGSFAIAHINGVVTFDGTTFKDIPESEVATSPEGIACAADGSIWVAHFQGVSHYADGKWTTYGSDKLASGDSANELVYDVKVAPDGKVWVVTSRSVAMFENDSWTVYQEGQGFNSSRFFNALAMDAKGRPWAAHSGGVDVFENGQWVAIEKKDSNAAESLAVDAKGGVWLGTLSDGVFLYDSETWTQYDRTSEKLLSNDIAALSTDSSGRVWLGTTYGLTVFDGVNWQTFLMSNSDLGDNDVRFVVINKDGPTLPAVAEKAKGSIKGKLENADGTPLADARLEVCVETLASTFTGDTPCSDQPFVLSTKTDAKGAFNIADVPAGYYVIVAETAPDKWAQLTDEFGITSERTFIQAGEEHDFKTLTVEKSQ
jgi:ligand-binding sensor domain-containing protein